MPLRASVLAAVAGNLVGAMKYTSYEDLPLGCYNFGYQFTPEMQNVTGQPFQEESAISCQDRCAATPGCAHFGYWSTGHQCWLGGADSVAMLSRSLGAVSGPARCLQETFACDDVNVPSSDFPGATAVESRQAWQTGQQPTNLQCWPRKANGFPAPCKSDMAVVLQDTVEGWPGRCEGLMKIENLGLAETCQSRCFGSPLCGVWAEENYTSGDTSMTCWQGMFGQNCYDGKNGLSPPQGAHFRAQRVMHGTFRVLVNTAHMQLTNMTKAFGIEMHPNWEDGVKACRMTCLSYLLCQFWQYSSVYGCWIEDDQTASLSYPLVNDGSMMNTVSQSAETVKAGEYIQHLCQPGGPTQPLPTDPPPGQPATHATDSHQIRPGGPGVGIPERPRITVAEEEPYPLWATMLIAVTMALCLGVIGAAAWMTMLDSEKMGSRGQRRGSGDFYSGVKGALTSVSGGQSFDSQQAPLVQNPSVQNPTGHSAFGGHFGFGHSLQNMHLGGHGGVAGARGYGHGGVHDQQQQGYGQHHLQQPPAQQQSYDPRYAGLAPPTRDALMQYSHQGY